MATKTIPQLTALGADADSGDLLEIADISSSNASRKVTISEVVGAVLAVLRANTGSADVSGVDFTFGTISNLGTPGAGVLTNCTGLPISSLVAGILAGNMTLGESAGQIVLDPTLSADGTWSGIMVAGTAGATLAFGDLIYLAAADSRWKLSDADAAATAGDVILGMCVLAAAADGDPTNVLLYGKIRADAAFPALTIGAPAYAGTTPGDIVTAQPSGTDDVIRVVGFGLTADVLMFCPSPFYITHT